MEEKEKGDEGGEGKIVAVGCAVLKTARMHGEVVKLGYVFDLRVDEAYQGRGIGASFNYTFAV